MKPEVAAAVTRLGEAGLLSKDTELRFGRVARRELVSVRAELRLLLYAGVLLATSGAGILVKENYQRIGPLAIVAALAAATALCFAWVVRHAAPFSWREAPSTPAAFDYVLLLAVLLLASTLAYVETQFHTLGPRWAYHLPVIAAIYLAAAYRWDSRTVLSLALSTLAAWRGVATDFPLEALFGGRSGAVRANAIALGLLFVAVGVLSVARRRKAHFEGVYVNLGLLLLFGGILGGVFEHRGLRLLVWLVAIALAAGTALTLGIRFRRPIGAALAVVALYLAFLRTVFFVFHDEFLAFLVTALSSVGLLAVLWVVRERLREAT